MNLQQWDAEWRRQYGSDDEFRRLKIPGSSHRGTFGETLAWAGGYAVRALVARCMISPEEWAVNRIKEWIDGALWTTDKARHAQGEDVDLNYKYCPVQFWRKNTPVPGWARYLGDELRCEVLIDGHICDSIMRGVLLLESLGFLSETRVYRERVRVILDSHDSMFKTGTLGNADFGTYHHLRASNGTIHPTNYNQNNHSFVALRAWSLLDHPSAMIHIDPYMKFFMSRAWVRDGALRWYYDAHEDDTIEDEHAHIDVTALMRFARMGVVFNVNHLRATFRVMDKGHYFANQVNGHWHLREWDRHKVGFWCEIDESNPDHIAAVRRILQSTIPHIRWVGDLAAYAEVLRHEAGKVGDPVVEGGDSMDPPVDEPDEEMMQVPRAAFERWRNDMQGRLNTASDTIDQLRRDFGGVEAGWANHPGLNRVVE